VTVLSQLQVLLTLDADEYAADIKRVQRDTEKWGKKMQSIGKKLTAGITTPMVAMGTLSVKAASDLNEAMNKVEVVFGSAADIVEEFGGTAARSVGMSERAALEAAGTFGNLFTTMGLGQKASADMSVSLVKLAGDLASFNNLNPEDVLEKLRSGLVGEVEPLRTLGINLNQAAVQAKAMEMGLADANGQLSQAALVQARYALILEQTKHAQGDFGRTSDGLANSTRILRAEFEDLQARLGQELLPAATEALHVFVDMLETFNQMPSGTRKLVVEFSTLAAATGPAIYGVGKLAEGVSDLSRTIAAAGGLKAWLTTTAGVATKANLAAAAVASWAVMMHKAVKTAKDLGAATEMLNQAYVEHEMRVRLTTDNYEDYVREMARAYRATHKIAPSQEELVELLLQGGEATERWQKETGTLTREMWENSRAVQAEAASYDQAMLTSAAYRDVLQQVGDEHQALVVSIRGAIDTQAEFQRSMDLLQEAIEGPLGKAYDDYIEKTGELRERMGDVRQQIEALEGKTWLSDSEKERLASLRDEYSDLKTALDGTTEAYERQRAEIMYNIASKMLLDAMEQGLVKDMNNSGSAIDEVYGALANLAEGFGLIDPATAKAQEDIGYLVEAFSQGKLSAEDFAKGVMGLSSSVQSIPSEVNVDIYIRQHGSIPKISGAGVSVRGAIPQAKGGDWVVRRPTLFLAGEAGPERATFTPLGRAPQVEPAAARVQVVVPITYSPAVSLGDEVEMERVLGPFVAERVRDALARAGV